MKTDPNKKTPLVLAILDGWGMGEKNKRINAIEAAKTPAFDFLQKKYPSTTLEASGEKVGLEKDQMSGSETGHLNIGAGRIVEQDVRIILEEISSGNFFYNPALLSAIRHAKKHGSKIHLMGLMGNSDSPHSHPDIFFALLILLKNHGLKDSAFFHLFTDGRDSFPRSSLETWQRWKKMINSIGVGKLASVCGRFYAMDRIKKWNRLKKAYRAIVDGDGAKASSFQEAIKKAYAKDHTDEFVDPTVILTGNKPTAKVNDNDSVIFFNLRSDRARQFTKLFAGDGPDKDKYSDVSQLKNICFVAMTNFGPDLNIKTAYRGHTINNTLPVALANFRQLYIAENEKFAHITYFINGGYPDPVGGEERIMIDSPSVKSYAKQPAMSAPEVAGLICRNIDKDTYRFYAVNFANADMLGHTGDFEATKKGVEAVDKQIGLIYKHLKKKQGTLVLTADHGNADQMIDKGTGRIFTFHTKNPVPFIIAGNEKGFRKFRLSEKGSLGNVAPTVLDLLKVKQPKQMTEESLLIK